MQFNSRDKNTIPKGIRRIFDKKSSYFEVKFPDATDVEKRISERKYDSALSPKGWVVDSISRIAITVPPVAIWESFVVGMQGWEVLASRMTGVVVNLVGAARLHGKLREVFSNLINTTDNDKFLRKYVAVELPASTVISSLYVATLSVIGVSWDKIMEGLVFVVTYNSLTTGIFGKFNDWMRKQFDLEPVFDKERYEFVDARSAFEKIVFSRDVALDSILKVDRDLEKDTDANIRNRELAVELTDRLENIMRLKYETAEINVGNSQKIFDVLIKQATMLDSIQNILDSKVVDKNKIERDLREFYEATTEIREDMEKNLEVVRKIKHRNESIDEFDVQYTELVFKIKKIEETIKQYVDYENN